MSTTTTRERPVLFNGDMVKAILAGTKTQTRRPMKVQPADITGFGSNEWSRFRNNMAERWQRAEAFGQPCPFGEPGDRLWVRETWRPEERDSDMADGVRYQADDAFRVIENTREAADRWLDVHGGLGAKNIYRWRPSIHMPRWASRLTLRVTGARLERLQSITPDDAVAEGIERVSHVGLMQAFGWKDYGGGAGYFDPVKSFASLWDQVATDRELCWDRNPWVWRISFERIDSNAVAQR